MSATRTPAPGSRTGSPASAPVASLGAMVLDAAARRRGVALQFRRDGRTVSISYPELGERNPS